MKSNIQFSISTGIGNSKLPTFPNAVAHVFGHIQSTIKPVTKTKPKLYGVWQAMKARCNNPNAISYKNYGAIGISVCPEWNKYIHFHNDMHPSYRIGLTLERINNKKGYSKENCKWVSNFEQQQNRRNSIHLTINGVTASASEWGRISGTSKQTITNRFHRGWSHEECLYGLNPVKSN